MHRSELIAWLIMVVTSGSIFAAFVVHVYPLGIFAALVVFSISTLIVFIGLDEESKRNADR